MELDPKIWDNAPPPGSPEFVDWAADRAWELKGEESRQFVQEAFARRRQAIRTRHIQTTTS